MKPLAVMHPLTAVFLAALSGGLILRWLLASRQIASARAHRNLVPEPFASDVQLAQHQKAADYCVARVRLGNLESGVEAMCLLLLTLGGGIAALDVLSRRVLNAEPWHGALVVASVLGLLALIGAPFSLWRTFRIETAFGFNRTTLATWCLDRLKGLALALIIGTPLLVGVLALMSSAGRWWWLYAWLAWMLVSAALTWAWPAFIAPLFNRFTPLQEGELKERIEALLGRCGFASKGVFVVDSSRRTAHGNAYFTGIGRNKRIVFYDSLIEELNGAEIEAILAHELGHFRLKHVAQGLIVSAFVALGGLALFGWAARHPSFYAALGVAVPSAHAALLLFILVVPVFWFFATPIAALWSRRHEFAADRFAARHASAAHLAGALVKLYRDNATTLTPDPLTSAFYDSHPPAIARIARLRALARAGALFLGLVSGSAVALNASPCRAADLPPPVPDETVIAYRQALDEDSSSPVLGDPHGDVTIVEFFDYACSYCKAIEPRLEQALRSDPHVRLILKEFPILTPESLVAARAALASRRQHKYRQFHEALMAYRGPWAEEAIFSTARSVGLDLARLRRDMASPVIANEIIANFNLARGLRIFQTPGFVVGDHILTGPSAEIDFPAEIDAARRHGS